MPDGNIALLCDPAGVISEVLVDAAGVASTGRSFVEIFPFDSRDKAANLIAAAEAPAGALLQIGELSIQFHVAPAGEGLLLVGSRSSRGIEEVCADISSRRSELRAATARIVAAAAPTAMTSELWNEISRLNNDLTAAQRELAKSNAHLRWLNEQKNQLLGMAAHDLRNPLAAILSYTEFVLDDSETLLPDQSSMLGRIRANTTFMLSLIDDVLDLSAIENGTVTLSTSTFQLDDAVNDVLLVCGPIAAKKNIALTCELSTTPPINADRAKVAQVLQNLVSNAIKFSLPETAINIVTAMAGRDEVAFEVRDQGQGMPENDLAKLFRPFSRLSVRSTAGEKSSGLGLAIVKRLVEAHGGSIQVSSVVGLGTTFRVVLPVAAQRSATQ